MRISAKQLLAHRGCWTTQSGEKLFEKNSESALLKAAELNFGLETDLRDNLGKIVISHDPPTQELEPADLEFISRFQGPVALNVKSDGLAGWLSKNDFVSAHKDNLFFFDMSVPETIQYRRSGLPIARRVSEYEPYSDSPSSWIWLDCFESDWYLSRMDELREAQPTARICIVSPELHKRPIERTWQELASRLEDDPNVLLCTDFPERFLDEWS